jgi:ADP-ribose pyrophosphatase YjhB (NUDIX family)
MTNESPVPRSSPPPGPELASAAVLRREDGRVLLLRHLVEGPFAGRWSLPIAVVGDDEAAEDALERVLREHVHVEPGPFEFEDTIYVTGDGGARFVVNAFLCRAWRGEPRFNPKHYADALWAEPATPSVAEQLLPEVREWLGRTLGAPVHPHTADGLATMLDGTRGALLAAFESVPERAREEALADGWSPLDVLAHVADVEAYYLAETDRLLHIPGHTWRGFNDAQWHDVRRAMPPEELSGIRQRLEAARERTRLWLASVDDEQLAHFGNHHERGAVRIGDRVEKIAHHEHEHAEQLLAMSDTARDSLN